MPFAICMVWREPKNHVNDCYIYMTNVEGYNAKSKKNILYPTIPSAIRPLAHDKALSVPTPPSNLEEIIIDSSSDHENDTESDCPNDESVPKLFNQHELTDLT